MSTSNVGAIPPTVVTPPRTVESYRIPSLGYRIVVAALRLVPLFVVLVGLPVAALLYLQSRSIELPVSVTTVVVFGIAMCAMSTARYVSRPTRAYGPVSIASALVTLTFLLVLLIQSTYQFGVPETSATIAVTYTRLVEVLLLVPLFSLLASIVTTVEDLRSPGERLPFDFPP